MRWFISDTHFGHANVIEYSGRPFEHVQQMDDVMIARWNKTVGEDDDVFMLGDFGLSTTSYLTDIFHALKGNKILIRGNHDGTVSKMKRIGFATVLEEATILIDGYEVRMVHYPKMGGADLLTLHGHVHEKGTPFFHGMQACMCVELWNYTPVSEKTVQKLIQKWVKDGNSSSRRAVDRSGEADAGSSQV